MADLDSLTAAVAAQAGKAVLVVCSGPTPLAAVRKRLEGFANVLVCSDWDARITRDIKRNRVVILFGGPTNG
jgi:hypothetical protein